MEVERAHLIPVIVMALGIIAVIPIVAQYADFLGNLRGGIYNTRKEVLLNAIPFYPYYLMMKSCVRDSFKAYKRLKW